MKRLKTKRIKLFFILFLLLAVALLTEGDRRRISAENFQRRIRYQITTVRESSAAEREVLSQTTIEGLPGTDFKINLDTGNFKMETHFVNDLSSSNRHKVRAHLATRRFYGYSPHSLPLYEEDKQTKIFETAFGDTILLFPFGSSSEDASQNGEVLKIEIVPTLLTVAESDRSSNLTINFDKQIPSGEISIVAEKISHRFNVEARIETDGRVVARGFKLYSLEEENEISILPAQSADAEAIFPSFVAKLSIDRIIRSRPQDLAGIKFDFYRGNESESETSEKIISQGAGISPLGGEISYPLGKLNDDSRDYELKFIVRPDDAEQ